MLDAHAIMMLFDLIMQTTVDNQLTLIARDYPDQAVTTEKVVYARDPVKSISQDMDMLKVTATIPPSKSVNAIAGHFYDRGVLYAFGGQSHEFLLPRPDAALAFVGYYVDRVRHQITLYVTEDFGTVADWHPACVPAALVSLRPDTEEILPSDITNLLPLYNFDTQNPGDKKQMFVPCIPPGGSTTVDRRPFYRNEAPILTIYELLGEETAQSVTHLYDSNASAVDLLHPLEETFQYLPLQRGVGIKPVPTRDPIAIAPSEEILFVSAKDGLDINTGEYQSPLMTLKAAASLFNAVSQYTTIYIGEGQYVLEDVITFNRDVTIIGHSADTADIRLTRPKTLMSFQGENTKIRNVRFHIATSLPKVSNTALLSFTGTVRFYNCLFRTVPASAPQTAILHARDLYLFNCVMHNADTNDKATFYDAQPTGYVNMQNIVVLGLWETVFQGSQYNKSVLLENAHTIMRDIDNYDYLPVEKSELIDKGSYTEVGIDLDGTPTDIGLYGGQYAARVPILKYPMRVPTVIRYAIPTMYTPVITEITGIDLRASKPANTEIFGAVSFNGGESWLKWDEHTGAWREIPLNQIHVLGNTADELVYRVANAPVSPRGELTFAWGLVTDDMSVSPAVQQAIIEFKTRAPAYRLMDMSKLDVLVSEYAVLLKNVTDDYLRNLLIVVA